MCIFAYGQTGSGKTHTMTGTDVRAPEGRGINYRALDDLFHLRDERSGEVRGTIGGASSLSLAPTAHLQGQVNSGVAGGRAVGCEGPCSVVWGAVRRWTTASR